MTLKYLPMVFFMLMNVSSSFSKDLSPVIPPRHTQRGAQSQLHFLLNNRNVAIPAGPHFHILSPSQYIQSLDLNSPNQIHRSRSPKRQTQLIDREKKRTRSNLLPQIESFSITSPKKLNLPKVIYAQVELKEKKYLNHSIINNEDETIITISDEDDQTPLQRIAIAQDMDEINSEIEKKKLNKNKNEQ